MTVDSLGADSVVVNDTFTNTGLGAIVIFRLGYFWNGVFKINLEQVLLKHCLPVCLHLLANGSIETNLGADQTLIVAHGLDGLGRHATVISPDMIADSPTA